MSEKICQSCKKLLSFKRFKIKPGFWRHKYPAREKVCIGCTKAKERDKEKEKANKRVDSINHGAEKLCLYCETAKPISEFRANNAKVGRSRFCASCNKKRAWLDAGLAHVGLDGKTNVKATFDGGRNYAEPGKSHQSETGRAVCASWGHFK